MLTMISWSDIKQDLAAILAAGQKGYWETHARMGQVDKEEDAMAPEYLEVRQLLPSAHAVSQQQLQLRI